MRVMQSAYMHWAKNQRPVRFGLSSSEVPHFAMERLGVTIADLALDGASRYREPGLRAAIARRQGVGPEQVVMADGTSMANMLAMAALIAPGDEVVVELPVYEPMVATAQFLGGRIRSVSRRADEGFRLDPADVAAVVTPDTRLIVLTNLHNPTGALTDEATLAEIGEIAARIGAYVLVDEVYLDAAATVQRSAIHLGERFVCTSSLTKVYGLSGLRCGWILSAPELAERMWRLNELFGVAQAHAAERLSTIALDHLEEVVAGTHTRLKVNRALLNAFVAARSELEATPMVHGITAFPKLLKGTPEALDEIARAQFDVGIVPGAHFGLADHMRVGIGGPTDMIALGLGRLGEALDAL